ncbi:MAG TPA: phenylalanine--tRNA ligase beta subunit-related protein [Tetragenococcus sp.]|nr:phenylalanine--tRNA ligase beta subunit-related protein [Tetragenococcus sp.]
MRIKNQLSKTVSEANLLVLFYELEIKKSTKEILTCMDEVTQDLANRYELSDIAKIEAIKNTREAYKTLGKSPSSYRNAAEAMLRRVVKGNGLYHINNVVDLQNIISVKTAFSIGSYDLEHLQGDIIWQAAKKGEHYQGIGKENIDIAGLPTLYDDLGAFGNPTSDSQRAMITKGKHKIMTVVYSFSGTGSLAAAGSEYEELLEKFCGVRLSDQQII